jgi:hypothetical protein
MFTQRLRIRQGRTEAHGMERVVVKLPEILNGVDRIVGIVRIVVAIPIVHIHGPREVQAKRSERLFKFMSQRQIGPVDVKPGVGAIGIAC